MVIFLPSPVHAEEVLVNGYNFDTIKETRTASESEAKQILEELGINEAVIEVLITDIGYKEHTGIQPYNYLRYKKTSTTYPVGSRIIRSYTLVPGGGISTTFTISEQHSLSGSMNASVKEVSIGLGYGSSITRSISGAISWTNTYNTSKTLNLYPKYERTHFDAFYQGSYIVSGTLDRLNGYVQVIK